jgi:DNA-directed RNA polymerase subunit K/omega
MSFKNSTAEKTTVTRDTVELEKNTDNIYESIVMLSKRSNQLNVALKEELTQKLQEFASTTDNLEEIFENREQIEISRFYERLPKPVAMAIEELMEDKIYVRHPEETESEES